jgi:hypothetical protein
MRVDTSSEARKDVKTRVGITQVGTPRIPILLSWNKPIPFPPTELADGSDSEKRF